jgi:predicted nucleotide-binding protein
MSSWIELEAQFSELRTTLQFSRLEIQWGDAGEHWRIAGGADRHVVRRFEALSRVAGMKLIDEGPPLGAEIDHEPDPLTRWYRALRHASGLFRAGTYAQQLGTDGQPSGFIFTGSIDRIAEASAVLCVELAAGSRTSKTRKETMIDSSKVFVVHGRDERLRRDFFSFLRALDLKPLEWSDVVKLTRKGSPYIGEILDAAFSHAQAVVVLLTPDDEVRLLPELCGTNESSEEREYRAQARPNVLFEAGMAFGRDSERTILVEVGVVKGFSDIAGRHVIRLTDDYDRRLELAERLRTAGCSVSTGGKDWLTTGHFTVARSIGKSRL